MDEQTSHSYQPSYMSDRLTFKTVVTRLVIALGQTDIALLSTFLHERSLDF
ncbi:hypothetical protein [uncultured Nostoc sp.]|uniref:hypothetical protein n=1 Tax=uncultured Nostoc sp. TaxID=340711 RepID=UPI0035C9A349